MAARTVGILSPGDMGGGLGRLLLYHKFRVVTNLEGRSARSRDLAKAAGIEDVGSDKNLISTAEIIISVLVPSKAVETAKRIVSATKLVDEKQIHTKFYIDANAIAPTTTKQIGELFTKSKIQFIDGSIIGAPPKARPDQSWYRPTFALSGPNTRKLHLDDAFDTVHVGPNIGQASALKMSFASLTKVLFFLMFQL
jgi:3-hydroxyisobutyrate dehydrogenase-like beta-hydroxyacid dehydrogenase